MITCNENHKYTIDTRPVPGVTEILNALFPMWACDEWYMARGSAVHSCYEMLAQGIAFDCDPVCQPYVDGWRSWAAAVKPIFLRCEGVVGSVNHQYAGTFDAIAEIDGIITMIDYKACKSATVGHQLAAYALAYEEMTHTRINNGMGVTINDEGRRSIEKYDLKKLRNEWIIVRSFYAIKQRMGKV
jgi:hypothetical protein